MFSGFTSFIPWYSAKRTTAGVVDTDLERGDENRPHVDDDRFLSVSIVNSSASSQERGLPNLPHDDPDNDLSTSGCGVGPSSEESVMAVVPGFLATIGSAPTEILGINPPPDSILRQLQDQANHSYSQFFHKTHSPKHTRSSRSSGPGGMHNGLGVLSPIYEPSSPDLKGLAVAQKEEEAGEPTTFSKKTSAPSVHSTTSTIQERMMGLQATHPGFLKRSLKRSLSQTSSGSLHSEASGAPQLPPLHFRPAFIEIPVGIFASPPILSPRPPSATCSTTQRPRVVVPTRPQPSTTNSPQRPQLPHSQPDTPQSLATPRSHRLGSLDHSKKCTAIHEDSGSEKSFVTATGGETGPGPGITAKHDTPSTAVPVIYPEDQGQPSNLNVVTSTPGHAQIERETPQHLGKTFSESETTFNITSDPQHGYNQVPATAQKQNRMGAASVMSIASTTVRNESVMADDRVVGETLTIVEDEDFIMERWIKTLFYSASGDKGLFSAAKGGDRKQYPVSSTCVLFWVGFVAPWCWLVGGWMPPRDALILETGTKGEKLKGKASMDVDREALSHEGDGTGLKKWILPDPSSSFKATVRAPSISGTATLSPREIEEARFTAADPWVRRCRIASIVGGAVLGLGLVATTIVLGVGLH